METHCYITSHSIQCRISPISPISPTLNAHVMESYSSDEISIWLYLWYDGSYGLYNRRNRNILNRSHYFQVKVVVMSHNVIDITHVTHMIQKSIIHSITDRYIVTICHQILSMGITHDLFLKFFYENSHRDKRLEKLYKGYYLGQV